MNKKLIFLTIFLLLIIIIISIFYHTVYNKNNIARKEPSILYNQTNILENTTDSSINNNLTLSDNIIIPNNASSNKTVKYEFTSADYLAVEGNPGILKIYELTDSQMSFEYNHAWNFETSTIDRKISGIAKINNENLYEFKENIDGYNYSLIINFSEEMITLQEISNGELISQINLWS